MTALRLATALITLAACLWAGQGIIRPTFAVSAWQFPVQEDVRPIAPEAPYAGVLRNGISEKLQFQVEANQYFTLEILRPTMGTVVVLSTPDGRVRRSTGCSYKQPPRIAEVTPSRTQYMVELRGCTDSIPEMSYQVRLSRPHPATQRERTQVTAARSEEQADSLAREYRATSNRMALHKYEEALLSWRMARDRIGELRTLLKVSALTRDVAQTEKAIVHVERALTISREVKDAAGEAESLLVLATLRLKSGDTLSARDYCNQALEISHSTGSREGEAEALFVVGDVDYDTGDLDSAAEAYRQAYSIWSETNNHIGRAKSLLALSLILGNRSELEHAKANAEEASSIFKSLGDKQWRARSATILGNIHSRLGREQDALDFFEEARAILQDSGDFFAEAILFSNIARTHSNLGDDSAALQYSKLALDRYRALDHRTGEANALWAIGGYYFRLGNAINAQRNLEDAIKAARKLSNKRLEGVSLRDITPVFESLGETSKAIHSSNEALELNRLVPDKRLESSTLVDLAHVYEGKRDFGLALQLYGQALQLSRSSQERLVELAALYGIVSCMRQLGRLNEALQQSETAIQEIESLRASVAGTGLRTSYFSSVKQHYDLQIDLLMRLDAAGENLSAGARAFEASERSHARSLLDSISEARSSISEGVDASLHDREVSLRTSLDAKSERYTQLLSVDPASKETLILDSEIRRLNAEYDELLGQLRIRSPRYAELVRPQPLNLKEIQQQVLDDESLLLEYALGQENSYLWAVTREDFASYVLPKRSEIEEKVRQVRELMTARVALPGEKLADLQSRVRTAEAQYHQTAAELSQILLGPVAGLLGTRRLVIVAEGVLQYLPFGALPTPQPLQSSSFTPLVVEHEIVNLPSASTLAVIRREAPLRGSPDRTVAVFADPVFQAADSRVGRPRPLGPSAQANTSRTTPRSASVASLSQVFRGSDALVRIDFPRLPSTRLEAEAILAMVPEDRRMAALGFDATKAAAMNPDLKRYRMVHFATHTVLNDDHPDLSSLVLSLVDERGNPQSGFLRLRDIYNLKLSAELVVLSACETALGKEVKGEGLMSMVRGFMYSGTPRVLASLWKVDDEATAELMKEFYKQVLESGLTPAAALRQAQIVQMQKKSRQSPYYWAGFQLQGEWK